MAGMLTMSLCAGTAVMAEEVQVPTVGQAGVTKNLHIAEGITVPDTTFTFNITQTAGKMQQLLQKLRQQLLKRIR